MKVGGDFTNMSGIATFTNYAGSTLEFNGSGNQFFTNVASSITLNRVVMNKTGGKLYLTGANSTMNIDTSLTMTFGNIVTRSLSSLEVNVRNNATTAVNAGNANSYVDGKLRRKVYAGSPLSLPLSLDFPVGDSSVVSGTGYELSNILFRSSTTITDLLSWFTAWPGYVFPVKGPTASECLVASYDTLPLYDHGYWTFLRANASFNGFYKVTLYNSGYTNNSGMGWTVVTTDTASNPAAIASWGLIGKCVVASMPTNVQRDSINTPALATHSFNRRFTTAQSTQPLPIELLYFSADLDGEGVRCKWSTASETNNDHFEVERSTGQELFEKIGADIPGCGQGICTETHTYSLYDPQPCKEIRYYRLRQVDIDGHFTFSDVVAVRCDQPHDKFSVFPNPAKDNISLSFFKSAHGKTIVRFTDLTGRLVKEEIIDHKKGYNTNVISIADLSSGIYYVGMKDPEDNSSLPLNQVRLIRE